MATTSLIYDEDLENSSDSDQMSGDLDYNFDDDAELQLSDDCDCHRELTDGDSLVTVTRLNTLEVGTQCICEHNIT